MEHDDELVRRLLELFENEILPETERSVARGNKIFGAAMLRKSDWSTVVVGANNETENPLWHGEVHTIKLFHEMPRALRPPPGDILFVSSHEPCPLCLSAIAWAGYDNFHYLFSHEDSRDSFNIGHDLRILKEVFGLEPGGYRQTNAYWTGRSIRKMAEGGDEVTRAGFGKRISEISARYDRLSEMYQANKSENDIPLN